MVKKLKPPKDVDSLKPRSTFRRRRKAVIEEEEQKYLKEELINLELPNPGCRDDH